MDKYNFMEIWKFTDRVVRLARPHNTFKYTWFQRVNQNAVYYLILSDIIDCSNTIIINVGYRGYETYYIEANDVNLITLGIYDRILAIDIAEIIANSLVNLNVSREKIRIKAVSEKKVMDIDNWYARE